MQPPPYAPLPFSLIDLVPMGDGGTGGVIRIKRMRPLTGHICNRDRRIIASRYTILHPGGHYVGKRREDRLCSYYSCCGCSVFSPFCKPPDS
jgi:hypothetical protein